jgi:hypothetical protein
MHSKLHSLALVGNTGLADGLKLPLSVVDEFFSGKTFEDFSKARESESKFKESLIGGFNNVIKAIGNLASALAGR